jgi:pimeloyl-ACP methyl ester carboxylesterase
MLNSFLDDYQCIGKMDIPVRLIWGRKDRTVPFHYSDLLLRAIPQAELHVIENGGHIPHYERPEVVNPILLDFLTPEQAH